MPLEEVIQKLASAIEANTAAIIANTNLVSNGAATESEQPAKRGRKPAAQAPSEPTSPTESAPIGPTLQDLRAAAQAVLDSNGNDPAPIAALNKEYGVKRISEIATEKYAEAIAKLKKITTSSAV